MFARNRIVTIVIVASVVLRGESQRASHTRVSRGPGEVSLARAGAGAQRLEAPQLVVGRCDPRLPAVTRADPRRRRLRDGPTERRERAGVSCT